jgi:amino acid adenylation domain-containing protein
MGGEVFPTSFGQQRLWFLDQVTPGTAAYNLARAFRLTGSLDQAALAKALRVIISRHESLRTIFVSDEGEVRQVVLSSLDFDLPVIDFNELPAEQREQAALRIAGNEAAKPFDLSTGPLFHARLLRISPDEHILLLVIHHIITDGWSLNVLFHEMGELYAGFIGGTEPQLPRLSLRYSDYSRWQRATITGDFLAGEIDYWEKKLRDAETVLQLPTDLPRPVEHSGRGKSLHFDISGETNKSLKSLAHSENATIFMALLAVFQILLGRYARQDSVLVGSPTAGRNDVDLETLIGFFVNTLIFRADLNPDMSFREMLRQTRATTLEAFAHQQMPFEKLVETLEPDRNLNRNPLFQVMFVLQNAPRQSVELPGLVMEEIEFESGIAKFDLNLEIVDFYNLHCTFEYDSDLFEEDTMRRMAGHFTKLVENVVAAPDDKLGKFSLLTEAEMQQFVEWNNTSASYPRELCVHAAFEEQVKRTPDKIALTDEKTRLSYQEVNNLSNRLARLLMQKGVQRDALVGVSLHRSVEMVIALLGILKAGAAYVPLDPTYPEKRLDFMIEDSRVNVVVTTPEFAHLWNRRNIDVLMFDVGSLLANTENTSSNPSPLSSAEDRMYVIYTSGSTGNPKGVEGTHRASINRFSWMWNTYPFLEHEICCQKTLLGFVDSIWEIFGPLLRGIPSVIVPDELVIDADRLVQFLSKYEITRIVLVPSLLRIILEGVEDIRARLPKLTLWTCSGEIVPPELVNRFSRALPKAILLNIYGSSEVAADVTCHEVIFDQPNASIPIGKPISNVQIFVCDRHLNQVPVSVPGEIYVGGDCLAQGYLGRPDLTSERFITHQFEPGKSIRLFKTGDLGRYLPNAEIEYLGRTDNQIKIRGIRIELGEIEAVLASKEEVRNAVVMLDDRSGQPRLTAYLEIHTELHPDVDELRRFLRSRLLDQMVPSDYLVVDAFPLLPSGKIDRKALAMQISSRLTGHLGHVAPRTLTEERLAAIWRKLLGIEAISITDNFFELGGHSLMVMQVVARIRKEFDVEIPMRSLFEDPTITGLAEDVEEAKASGLKASAPISSFLAVHNSNDQLRAQIDKMSRAELEEMLRQVLKERSAGSLH